MLHQKTAPDVDVAVSESGTGGGFEAFCARQDRHLRQRLVRSRTRRPPACADAGIEYTEILQVATDALTMVVHPDLAVDCLTADQIIALVGPIQGHELERDRPQLPGPGDLVFGPGTDSGTYDYMAADVSVPSRTIRDDYEASEDDNVLVQGVAGTEGAVGYSGTPTTRRTRTA